MTGQTCAVLKITKLQNFIFRKIICKKYIVKDYLIKVLKVSQFRNVFLVSSLSSKKRMKTSQQVVNLNLLVRFLEETPAWKNHFEFVWPLAQISLVLAHHCTAGSGSVWPKMRRFFWQSLHIKNERLKRKWKLRWEI